jgi:nucleoside-diphosphate-sugar epimerase
MKLLVFGGTKFLGRATVEAALARGDEVTLVNRGVTNPDLFPEVERIRLDLGGDLDALAGRAWDAAIDLDPTQLPRHTRRRAELLAPAVRFYVFVSSISVYADLAQAPDESSAVHEPPDPEPKLFSEELYGGLKVGSERAVQAIFDERCAIVRPGLIVGPHDPTERFTYWPRRLAEGGAVLAPGDPRAPLQIVDARDLGAWLVQLAGERIDGVFNATGPAEPLTLGEALERISTEVGGDARLIWIDEQRVLDAGVRPWMELPLWIPRGQGFDEMQRADISGALAAGLAFRPLERTARDTLVWSREAGEQRPTLSRERESAILAAAAST